MVRKSGAIDETRPCPPYFAGTIWYKSTKKFIKENADGAEWKAKTKVGDIDVDVLEWKVGKDEAYAAFFSVSSVPVAGGKLRLYVAPAYGYVLPRVEYVGSGGKVATTFDAAEFQKTEPGIYIPRHVSERDHNEEGRNHFVKYVLTSIESVNQRIPDEEFRFEIPPGTVIQDIRTGVNKITTVGPGGITSADLRLIIKPRRGGPEREKVSEEKVSGCRDPFSSLRPWQPA
jgi:hypothetical protein